MEDSKVKTKKSKTKKIKPKKKISEENLIPELENLDTILVIGDIHFQFKAVRECEELIAKIIHQVQNRNPNIIIILGDVLDTCERAHEIPFNMAYDLIKAISKDATVYILMGNHDLINASQFLTNRHFFRPYTEWPNIVIVDKAIKVELTGEMVVMCPYVPKERFIEALDTTDSGDGDAGDKPWKECKCVFSHVEVNNIIPFNKTEEQKKEEMVWLPEYPPLISAHIHKPQNLGSNIYYIGSARQVDSNEDPEKYIWGLSFTERSEYPLDDNGLSIEYIDLGLRAKKEFILEFDELESFDLELSATYKIKIKVNATTEQWKLFKVGSLAKTFKKHDISVVRQASDSVMEDLKAAIISRNNSTAPVTFEAVLSDIVKNKTNNVQRIYDEIFNV